MSDLLQLRDRVSAGNKLWNDIKECDVDEVFKLFREFHLQYGNNIWFGYTTPKKVPVDSYTDLREFDINEFFIYDDKLELSDNPFKIIGTIKEYTTLVDDEGNHDIRYEVKLSRMEKDKNGLYRDKEIIEK